MSTSSGAKRLVRARGPARTARPALKQRLADAEWMVEALLSGQIDAVLDRNSETVVLLRRAQEELRLLNETLERRVQERTADLMATNAELEAFVFAVSHDLRAPLRRMEGFSRVLLEEHGRKLDPKGRHYLARIRASTGHVVRLIDALLPVARIAVSEMHRTRVDLSAEAQAIAAVLRRAHPERSVTFVIEPHLVVSGDRELLRALLEHLFDNAWKFTSRHRTARIEFGTVELASGVAYVVRDDGAGFDITNTEGLFEPFRRLHREDEFEGVGIGLATVQRIVRRHGGRAWIEGAVEQGASVYFTLET